MIASLQLVVGNYRDKKTEIEITHTFKADSLAEIMRDFAQKNARAQGVSRLSDPQQNLPGCPFRLRRLDRHVASGVSRI